MAVYNLDQIIKMLKNWSNLGENLHKYVQTWVFLLTSDLKFNMLEKSDHGFDKVGI